MAALSRVVAALSLLLVWSAAVIGASELTEPDRPEAPQDDVLELMKERGFSDEEMEMVKEKPQLLDEFRNLLQPGPQVPIPQTPDPQTPGPQTPDPQTPVPRLPGLVHRLLPEAEQEETPDPQTPGPQTPDPQTPDLQTPDPQTPGPQTPDPQTPDLQTPDPQTPVPRLPVLVDRLLAEAEQEVMEELEARHNLGLLDSEEVQILAILEWKAHEGTLGDGGVMEILQNDAAEWVGHEADEVMKEIYRKRTEKENSPPLAFYGGDKEPDDEYHYESTEEEGEEEEGTVNELLAEAEEDMYTDDGSEWHTIWQDNERGESDDGQEDKEEAYYEWNMETRPAEPEPVDYTPYENAYYHHGDGYYHYGDGSNYHGDPITMDPVSHYYDDSWYNYRYYHHARSHRVYWGILGGFAGLIVMVTVGAAAAFFYQKRRKRRFLYKPLSSSVIV